MSWIGGAFRGIGTALPFIGSAIGAGVRAAPEVLKRIANAMPQRWGKLTIKGTAHRRASKFDMVSALIAMAYRYNLLDFNFRRPGADNAFATIFGMTVEARLAVSLDHNEASLTVMNATNFFTDTARGISAIAQGVFVGTEIGAVPFAPPTERVFETNTEINALAFNAVREANPLLTAETKIDNVEIRNPNFDFRGMQPGARGYWLERAAAQILVDCASCQQDSLNRPILPDYVPANGGISCLSDADAEANTMARSYGENDAMEGYGLAPFSQASRRSACLTPIPTEPTFVGPAGTPVICAPLPT